MDETTRFSAARFLPGASTKQIYEKFVECWFLIYTELPNRIRVGQESFLGKAFFRFERFCNVNVSQTGFESHYSLGLGKQCPQPLRNTFRKVITTHPHVFKELLLVMPIKAINDTLGSK